MVSTFYAFALLLCLCVMSVCGTRSCDGAVVCGLSDAGEACALLRRPESCTALFGTQVLTVIWFMLALCTTLAWLRSNLGFLLHCGAAM